MIRSTTGWTTRRLGDVATVISGFAFKSNEFGTAGVPVIKISNVRDQFIDLDDVAYVDKDYLSLDSRFHVRYGDILISLTGSHLSQPNSVVGRVARFGFRGLQCLLNQRAGKITVHNKAACDAGFLFYLLCTADKRREIALKAHGAANQANVSPSQVESIEVSLPNKVCIQEKIASILSAYDDLIENNTRRIAILETMAQAIYREWFVEFRFPSHEKVRFVESPIGKIPEAWEYAPLGSFLASLDTGKRPKGGSVTDGVPSIGAENINGVGRHNFQSEKYVPEEFFARMKNGIVKDRDVAIYKDGAYIGRSSYFRDGFPHRRCCVNEHVFLLRTSGSQLTPNQLYVWLNQADT